MKTVAYIYKTMYNDHIDKVKAIARRFCRIVQTIALIMA